MFANIWTKVYECGVSTLKTFFRAASPPPPPPPPLPAELCSNSRRLPSENEISFGASSATSKRVVKIPWQLLDIEELPWNFDDEIFNRRLLHPAEQTSTPTECLATFRSRRRSIVDTGQFALNPY
ncbi:unnamed protein product [Heligmosomoides polygyrus]|uniref:AGC-kinase C-terminal domain-containing protein n=1 Tax=Heligmosomoides polygyrus TaxID=6339 RepID=A0A183FZV8_HELPZ|nr:unnamed protein product [Heligmosomoides polygyrus]